MIGNIEFKNGKIVDNGETIMSKREMKIFDDHDRRQKAGKNISYSFEPMSLWQKICIHVKKDRRGNVVVYVWKPEKDKCHKFECKKKVKPKYVLCREHLKK